MYIQDGGALIDDSKRVAYFDLLNVLCCFGVVCLHMNNSSYSYSTESYWLQALAAECLFYYAVPFFYAFRCYANELS